jgi:hypothetical protein
MELLETMKWIETTGLSTAIRESTLMFPVLEGTHLLTVPLSAGTILLLDLRLLGWGMRKTPVSVIFEQLRPWSLLGFTINFITGVLLFWSEPVKCYTTASFIFKMIFLVGTGVNALAFDRLVYPTVAGWDNSLAVPGRAQLAGWTSMLLWAGVIFCGRWTAYF